jgi:hypothetical protein
MLVLFLILIFYLLPNNLFLTIFLLEAQGITLLYFLSLLQAICRKLSFKNDSLENMSDEFKQKQL